jgi:hypothetical protein
MPKHHLIPALLLVAASPAAAGWLVTHDGDVVKTAGDWRLDGALVVFTTEDGRLSSIRARDVDLEASRARSVEPKLEPAAGPATRTGAAVLVLTDEDVAHVWSGVLEPEAVDPQMAAEPPEGMGEGDRRGSLVEVVDWRDRLDVESNTLVISGSVTNRGPGVATSTQVAVRLVDRSGELLDRRQATLGTAVMQPGAVAPFTATFPGNPGFATVEFDITNRGFSLRPATDPAEALPIDQ